ncbi:SGNH/GDSL hydrolase family protein [Lawsonibacter faecis]|uniref:SGNH/GDSL hydrolase family protein n=1 Tax=Lawsonibacter faecis TaxID=2763052 RepID=A0A8J6MEG2_9FIRM|nr:MULTISPECIES: SGNH/GDSL hydrolase family protein [Oscillospiraceae]MTQ98752.1 hypothetical protein [Pseudoflavonifractor sp. BIOML-A16]MTR08013.1 hypothetical protein [Pseudoflavonifractor sp. BIOML-A15]MTR34255.1 hypothetical protein [Pseudoflavonifractor sp. BIOML-A14]MTR74996.1 hypothetical protein [Pseudoflavonifractor sp. BIOML-A18]MTS66206.1 hypothetical protein [Pseudoflavonifractor sp. BIOML-A5]MTS73527.1 hypothetical protein [Pseudoflavonifractor sp. BIOML-A8]MTS92949.1 hypotheti
MDHTIVAFGDGNTRFYLGDEGCCGPLELAWPAQMADILCALGVKAEVRNEGYPGEPAAFARAEFERVARGADLCVVGFGLDDIRRLERTMSFYLSEMEDVIRQAEELDLALIVLGIPWFDEDFGGALVQTRLPKWNGALQELCERYHVPFVDLYTSFGTNVERWYCEKRTPRRHLSAAGQRRVAEMVLPLALQALK